MQKYQYMNTGIEWLGEVPTHWGITPIKKEFSVIPSNVDKKTEDEEESVKLCNYVDVYYNAFIDTSIDFMIASASEHEIKKFRLKKGDVLITKDSEDPFDIAVPALVRETEENLLCGYHLSMIRTINNKMNGSFLFWSLKNEAIVSQLYREATGVTRWAIASKHIKNSTIAFPPLPEQKVITDYLHLACTRIDRIIAIKEEQLEKIEGYLSSICHKFITQGVSNKDFFQFDNDFLQKVPKHWKVWKLRYILQLKNGKLITNEELVNNGDYPIYGGNGIMGYTDKFNYEDDLLILGRVGAKCGNVHYTNERIWVSDNAIAVRSKINYKFMLHLLKVINLHRLASDTAQPLLVGNNVKKLYVSIPPSNEQVEILNKIERAEDYISKLIMKVSKQIETLKSYRKSLIHECVTGKKQVAEPVLKNRKIETA